MRHLILFSTILLLTMHAGAQSARKTRTITTSFSKNGTISGDTTFFKYDGQSIGQFGALTRFFNRNLRVPMAADGSGMELGTCNLFLIVDTAGKVTKTWCDSVTNTAVEKEVLRVAGKLATMKPTTIKGKPVFTKVMASIIMAYGKDNEPYTGRQADVIVIAYDPVHKKALGR
ncbi:MAG: hypothetical protein ACJ751_17150 [Niastella sp.]|uniref:hypothetical protein n=1 Tax=Niastella sp. TaxID=1869183 RepID=UPI00389A7F67